MSSYEFFGLAFFVPVCLAMACRLCRLGCGVCQGLVGEFDPGSGRTLAACLTHASRAVRPLRGYTSGERVSNTWVICLALWDKPGKLGLIPDMTPHRMVGGGKLFVVWMDSRPISLVVR